MSERSDHVSNVTIIKPAAEKPATFKHKYYVYQFGGNSVEANQLLQSYDNIYEVRKQNKFESVHYNAVIKPRKSDCMGATATYYPLQHPEYVYDSSFYSMIVEIMDEREREGIEDADDIYVVRKGLKRHTFGSIRCFYRNMRNTKVEWSGEWA